jgi:methionyl-tRNA formyltransferase
VSCGPAPSTVPRPPGSRPGSEPAPVRLVFFGTPAPAVPVLNGLAGAGHDVALVVTQPERRRGRGAGVVPSPVQEAATELGLAVRTPNRAREVLDDLTGAHVDAGVVTAFGQLLPAALLEAVPFGLLNLHLSVLPRWRGAAPVERAILAGDAETGVSVMRLDPGLDTGPVFTVARTPIGADETAGELTGRLISLGIPRLLDVLEHLPEWEPTPQVGDATYAEKLTVDEFHLDPTRPADELARVVRAGNPRPGAWLLVDGKRVKVLRATASPTADAAPAPYAVVGPPAALQTARGELRIDEVQVEGRRPTPGDAWLAGYRQRHVTLLVS